MEENCIECGSEDDLYVIMDGGEETEEYICGEHLRGNPYYAECRFCGYDGARRAHPVGDLNQNGECPIHEGETLGDGDEADGWADNIERWREE